MIQFSETLLKAVSVAQNVAVLTGAGISAESGIKTFRDPDGLWAKFNPAELASVDGFMSNPELVWSWYQHRVEIIRKAEPNPGHYAIAEFEKIFPEFTLITQNVDRLHQRAGSANVWELHGNIVDNHCFDCKNPYFGETNYNNGQLPLCPQCGGRIRPSVVWFGEMLPSDAISAAEYAAITCDVFFSVGTSAEVYPAANLPIIAKRAGAFVIEVNPRPTAISSFMDICLEGPSGIILPMMIEALKNYKNS